jgi:homoprotocatechuate degradation regulator HpaR
MKDSFKAYATRRSLPMALLRARETLMEVFRPLLAQYDVTEQQWRVLRVVAEAGRLDATEVAVRASILAPSLTRIIKNLEQRKWIKRCKDAGDGRRVILELTPAGRAFIERVFPEISAVHIRLEEAIGTSELKKLLDMLETVNDLTLR